MNPISHTASAQYSQVNVKFPVINLPTFSGNYQDWTSFIDTFSALIDTNESGVQKWHYLKASLIIGKPAKTVSNFELKDFQVKIFIDDLMFDTNVYYVNFVTEI